jgi:hypothetical protein
MNPAGAFASWNAANMPSRMPRTKGARRPLQGGGLAKHDAVIEHAWISVEGQGPEQAQDNEDRGSVCRFEKQVWHAVPLNRRLLTKKLIFYVARFRARVVVPSLIQGPANLIARHQEIGSR